MSYNPGLHILAELQVSDIRSLENHAAMKVLLDDQMQRFNLCKLGEVYHDFNPVGFTAIVCLSESHISMHTWPEYGRVNLDIYLSNFRRNNDETGWRIFDELVAFFNAEIISKQAIQR